MHNEKKQVSKVLVTIIKAIERGVQENKVVRKAVKRTGYLNKHQEMLLWGGVIGAENQEMNSASHVKT